MNTRNVAVIVALILAGLAAWYLMQRRHSHTEVSIQDQQAAQAQAAPAHEAAPAAPATAPAAH